MPKEKKMLGGVYLRGIIAACCAYVLGILLLCLLLTRGIVPESAAFPALASLYMCASCLGGLMVARKTSWGTMASVLLLAVVFFAILLLAGLVGWGSEPRTYRSGILLLSGLAGAILAGVLSARKGGRGRKKRKHP